MMPKARNLVSDAQMQYATETPIDPELFNKLMATPGLPPQSLVLTITYADHHVLVTLSVAPGTYHMVHDDLNNHAVYRQEPLPGAVCNPVNGN